VSGCNALPPREALMTEDDAPPPSLDIAESPAVTSRPESPRQAPTTNDKDSSSNAGKARANDTEADLPAGGNDTPGWGRD